MMVVRFKVIVIVFIINGSSKIFYSLLGNQSPEWQTPIMTKILFMTKNGLKSIYIIDISIYLDLPQEEQTETDVHIVD